MERYWRVLSKFLAWSDLNFWIITQDANHKKTVVEKHGWKYNSHKAIIAVIGIRDGILDKSHSKRNGDLLSRYSLSSSVWGSSEDDEDF